MTVVQRDDARNLYYNLLVARAIELKCAELSGLWYPAIGEEAAIVGTYWCSEPEDVLYPHYRGSLVVQWMRGRTLEDVFRVMLHRHGAASRGRHAPPFDGHPNGLVMPFASIMLGPNMAMAAGSGLALKHRGSRAISICAFGDGTSGTGDFHETLNMAAVLRLPTLFVCQNNQFSISTHATKALAAPIHDWARGYGIPSSLVDGNDVLAVVEAVRAAAAHTRESGGPSFVELSTYRRTGHFVADPARYRDSEELRRAEKADPITRFSEYLVERLGFEPEALDSAARQAHEHVANAVEVALGDRELTAGDLDLTGVYAR
jgi:TPP-dependent pyruvate/acetoin dehydrogenase alpha subunit